MSRPVERCCELIFSGGGWRPGRCSRPGKIERNGKLYCAQHDPIAVEARKHDRNERWARQREGERLLAEARKADRDLRERALTAIRAIANGHNDPQALAREVLSEALTSPGLAHTRGVGR